MTRSDTSKPSLNRVDFHFKENEEIVWGLSGNSINPIWTVLKEHQVVLGSTKYTCILSSYTACKLYIYITYIHKCQTLSPFQSPLIKRSTLRPSTTLFYIKKTSASWLYDIILPRWASRPPFFCWGKNRNWSPWPPKRSLAPDLKFLSHCVPSEGKGGTTVGIELTFPRFWFHFLNRLIFCWGGKESSGERLPPHYWVFLFFFGVDFLAKRKPSRWSYF